MKSFWSRFREVLDTLLPDSFAATIRAKTPGSYPAPKPGRTGVPAARRAARKRRNVRARSTKRKPAP